jgi:hypothetical protein
LGIKEITWNILIIFKKKKEERQDKIDKKSRNRLSIYRMPVRVRRKGKRFNRL